MSGSNNARVSQVVAEALVACGNDYVRASQIAIEAFTASLGNVRASQVVAEALVAALGNVRASQVVAEVITAALGTTRVSQVAAEALFATLGFVRVTQCCLELLIANVEVPLPQIFPALAGLGYSVVKRPIWNTVVGAAASGRDARAALQVNPIYEFDLTYDFLSDGAPNVQSTYPSDLKTLMGFFNSVQGGAFPFLFTDPDDHSVVGQAIGTGDGTTTNFTIVRTFGGGGFTTTEPVGYLNQTTAPNVYVGGTLQSVSNYSFITTSLCAQVLKLNSAPAAGAPVTMDFSFYYAVRFKDDQYDFEKLFSQMWDLKKLTLRTVRN